LDSSIVQGPFSVAPCQTLVSRFATFLSPYAPPLSSGAGGLASSGAGFAAAAVEEGWRPGLHLSFDDELSSPLPPGISPAMAAMYR
jgi:hypothetical protein